MAKIVDVTDVPELPGAGLLHFDDGRPPLIALPEIANEHRERLGINALDNGVAGPGTGTPDPDAWKNKWGGTLGQVSPPPQGAAIAPDTTTAAPATPPSVPQQGAPGAEQPAAASPQPQGSLAPDALAASDARLNDALRTGRLPGSGVPQPFRPAGFSPDMKKVVTEAGPAYDPRAAAERMQAGENVLDAQLNKAATDKSIAEATAAHAQAANISAQQQLAHQQAEIQRKQQAYKDQNQHLTAELADYTKTAAPDPNRFFKNRGVVANIFSAIGQGLGAFGASVGHTQNFAFEYVQSQIKADIAQQQAEYEAGRADRNNALARFVNYYHGDMDMAKAAMLQAQNKVAETETQAFAAQAQSKDISASAQVLAAQFQQQQLLAEQQRAELAQGKTTTTSEDKFHQASGGGDGSKPLTLEQQLAIRKGLAGKPAKDQGALGLTAQAEARQKALYSTKSEPLAPFGDSLSHRATLMGIHFDPKTGELTNKSGKPVRDSDLDVPVGAGVVGKHFAGDVLTPKAMELRRAEENSVRLHAAAVYNHSISAEEGAAEADHTIGSTDSAKLANMRYLAEEYRKRKLAIDTGAASIDPRLVNDRDEAERAVNYSRATGQPLPWPSARAGSANGDPELPDSDVNQ